MRSDCGKLSPGMLPSFFYLPASAPTPRIVGDPPICWLCFEISLAGDLRIPMTHLNSISHCRRVSIITDWQRYERSDRSFAGFVSCL